MRRVLVCAAVVLGLLSRPAALETQQTFSGRVDLIRLDVSVVDKKGEPVRDLTQADFQIKENAELQSIQTFAAIVLPDRVTGESSPKMTVPADVVSNTDSESDRLIVLVIDDTGSEQFRDQWVVANLKKIGHAVVDRLGARDLGAVVYTQNNRAGQEFTRDTTRLSAAVDRFVPGVGRPLSAYRSSVDTLRAIADVLATVPERRKTVVFVSAGIPFRIEDLMRPGGGEILELYWAWDEMQKAARQANANIYSVNPSGLFVPADVSAPDYSRGAGRPEIWEDQTKRNDFLTATSVNTGGKSFINSNEFLPQITQIFHSTDAFYLLGYTSSHPAADGKYRRIEVKVNRPGVTVTTRAGYYGPTPPRMNRPAVVPSIAALSELLPSREFPLSLTAAPFAPVDASGAKVVVTLSVPPSPAGTGPERFDVVINAFDVDTKLKQSLPFQAAIASSGAPHDIHGVLTLPAGRYQIRAGVTRSSSGKSASVYGDVDVPNFSKDQVALSGIVLTSSAGSAATPGLGGLLPVAPHTQRGFGGGDEVEAFWRIYQLSKAPVQNVTMTITVVDARGAKAFETTETRLTARFDPSRAVDEHFRLPLEKLANGEYLLVIKAAADRFSATRQIRFSRR